MGLYAFLDRFLPRSYLAKTMGVAVVCGQLPLIVLLVLKAVGAVPPALVWPAVAGASMLGLAGLAVGLAAVLRPIGLLEEAFTAFEAGHAPQVALPERHGDAVGRLMARTARLMRMTETRIVAAERLAERDPLTGLLNRRGLERSLAARRGLGERGALLMMDLDHFKRVNDDHGHDEGDRVLREMAELLRHQMRRPDLAARFGGEEFVVYLSGLGREAGLRVAERLRMAVEDRVRVAGRAQTVSIGVAPWPPGEAFDEILKRADGAVYAAKAAGRNRVRLAPTMRAMDGRAADAGPLSGAERDGETLQRTSGPAESAITERTAGQRQTRPGSDMPPESRGAA